MPTNNLLATGGMKQQGGTTDPISGNEVPVGALKNEVRDDVDAKLSDGEFVFPADVTRYIGLDKLMQIREAAKQGLQKMDSMGQMGNAEEVAGEKGDEDQFSSHIDDIIATVDGKENVKKFAGGGGVNTTSYSGAPLQGFSMELYEDPKTKITRYIPFLSGKALLPIPSGYVKKDVSTQTTDTTTTTTTPATSEVVSRTGGGSGGGGTSTSTVVTDTSGGAGGGTTPEGFGGLQSGATGIGAFASMVPGKLGLVLSAANKLYTKVQNEKISEANAKAVDASALSAMGFSAASIKAAQEAAAKATLEGKSAKDIAVAAANAASTGIAMGAPKDSLDALMGITNAFNTVTNQQAKENTIETTVNKSLADAGLEGQVPTGMWNAVVDGINNGLTATQALQNAISISNVTTATQQQEARDKADAQAAADAKVAEATKQQEARDAINAAEARAMEATKQQEARDAKEAKDAQDAAAAKEAAATAAANAKAAADADAAAATAGATASTGTKGGGGYTGGGTGGGYGAGGGPGSTGTGSGVGTGGVGPTCFVKGSLVTLADGSKIAIEDVAVGDFVLGQGGPNEVVAHDRPQLIIPDVRNGTLYGINGSKKFITSEHPVMTKDGWKAIDQENAKKFEPHLSKILVGSLAVGDLLVKEGGELMLVTSIDKYTEQPQQQLYNLMLNGDHTYYVNEILVHNKEQSKLIYNTNI